MWVILRKLTLKTSVRCHDMSHVSSTIGGPNDAQDAMWICSWKCRLHCTEGSHMWQKMPENENWNENSISYKWILNVGCIQEKFGYQNLTGFRCPNRQCDRNFAFEFKNTFNLNLLMTTDTQQSDFSRQLRQGEMLFFCKFRRSMLILFHWISENRNQESGFCKFRLRPH